ncbi:hypothetical protein KQY27_01805 [Methanobrevibacter sp. TMH8]|nr:hypothetical protein [Methanobrevibacter sp. TMH8]
MISKLDEDNFNNSKLNEDNSNNSDLDEDNFNNSKLNEDNSNNSNLDENKSNKKQLNTEKKVLKLLNSCLEESDAPITFYDIHVICRNLKISAPKLDKVIDSLKKEGFLAIKTHFSPIGIKSDIGIEELKAIIESLVI